MARPEWIEVGRVSRAHGVGGEVRVVVTSDNPDRVVVGAVFRAMRERPGLRHTEDSEPTTLEIECVRGMEGRPIVAFVGIGTREAAENLRGLVLQVHASDLPELDEGEFYSFDLEGLEVRAVDRDGVVGRVTEVLESPAHDLLAVRLQEGGELLVPFTLEIVPVVDMDEGFVVVDLRRVTTEGSE